MPSTCGNCPLVHDHPDLRGHQPDPARGHGPPVAEGLVAGRGCTTRYIRRSARQSTSNCQVFGAMFGVACGWDTSGYRTYGGARSVVGAGSLIELAAKG